LKGIILAGGLGTRLQPLTRVVNKHLLPVGNFPMIFYPLFQMSQSGITEILIVTGKGTSDALVNLLGSGREYGLEFTYKIQDQPGGIAQALGLAKNFVGPDHCLVILGDNICTANLAPFIRQYQKQPSGATVFLKKVPDPHRYGIAQISEGRIVRIDEKPSNPQSDLCVTGIYLYDSQVFELIQGLKPSHRDELEITDVNREYLRLKSLTYQILEEWWTDAGTFEALRQANALLENYNLQKKWPLLTTGRD
jgi:glucose-1-phosphate thymidylyltransferase